MQLLALLSVVSGLIGASECGNILGVFPHTGITHWYVFKPLMEELALRGHNVTVLSYFPRTSPMQNYVDVTLQTPESEKERGYLNLTEFEALPHWNAMSEMAELYKMAEETEETFSNEKVLSLASQKFDLVIMEFFNTDIYHALAHKIQAPVIGVSSHDITSWATDSVANPDEPSYVPHMLSSKRYPFTTWARTLSTVELITTKVLYNMLFLPRSQETAEKYLGSIPKIDDLRRNTSLILLNSHFSINNPRPLNPNVIHVGGLNVGPPAPLSNDLQQLMDKSKAGVIYFSMGTICKASTWSDAKKAALIKVFAQVKQTILWKYDGEMKDVPKNVHIAPWFPQRDLFAHKNMALFVSHCGNLGMNEAVHEGVPIICIPMFGDQPYNAKSIVSQGMAEELDFYTELTYEKIKETITRVLSDPKYKKNARRVSNAYRDRPMTPLQTAVYWTEYVLRHQGAYHIRSAARNLPWYEYYNYDVMLYLHAAVLCAIYLIMKLCFAIVKCLRVCFKSESKYKLKKS